MMNYNEYNKHYSQYHDGTDADYDAMYNNYKRFIKRTINDSFDAPILDIGCGIGLFINSLMRIGYKNISGIDISSTQINMAKSRGLPCELVESTIEFLNQKPNNFEYIFMIDVFEHIPVNEQIEFMKACRLALKPKGKLVIIAPNANSVFASRYRYIDQTHTCIFTDDSLYSIYAMSGFDKCKIGNYFDGRLPIWLPRPNIQGFLFAIFYIFRRMESIAYFGYKKGRSIPLTINLLAIGTK